MTKNKFCDFRGTDRLDAFKDSTLALFIHILYIKQYFVYSTPVLDRGRM